MGLDIYLYRYEDKALTDRLEAEYEAASSKVWAFLDGRKYGELTEAEKDTANAACKTAAAGLGLDDCGSDERRKKRIEIDSAKHPEHMFKVGYFRSSYNDGGINSVLHRMIGEDLHSIMGHGRDDDYRYQPDWRMCKARAEQAISSFDKFIETNGGGYRVMRADWNEFRGDPNTCEIDSEEKALAIFLKELQKHRNRDNGGGDYGNRDGDFFLQEPLKVSGVISGVNARLLVKQKMPCSYLIYEDKEINWYRQALEIIVETCDYVLQQPDQDKYWLHWSG